MTRRSPWNCCWFEDIYTASKVSKYGVFPGPYFPVFELNMEIYSVNLRIQSKYRKIRTRKNSVFGHFSRSVAYQLIASSPKITKNGRSKSFHATVLPETSIIYENVWKLSWESLALSVLIYCSAAEFEDRLTC